MNFYQEVEYYCYQNSQVQDHEPHPIGMLGGSFEMSWGTEKLYVKRLNVLSIFFIQKKTLLM